MDFIGVILINTVLIAAAQWIATTWLRARLEASIRHEYDRQLENSASSSDGASEPL